MGGYQGHLFKRLSLLMCTAHQDNFGPGPIEYRNIDVLRWEACASHTQ